MSNNDTNDFEYILNTLLKHVPTNKLTFSKEKKITYVE